MPYARKHLKHKGPKVSLKQNNRLKFRKGKFGSQKIKEVWDNNKTLRQNYEKLGLVANTNKMEEAPKTEEPLIQFIEAEEIKREDNIMSVYDQNYIKKLIDKHGDDVDAMFRDIKLNTNQLTVGQLKKKIEKYYRVQELYAAPKEEE